MAKGEVVMTRSSPGIELLPCPFCGETDVGFGRTGQKWQTVACNECGAEGPCTEIDRDLIVQKWNARALQPATTTAGQVWCEPCGHHVMPEQIAECCAEPCALATGGDAVAGEAKAAEDIIISYFDSHGINDARAGAFNILDRLREAGLTVTAIRSPDEAATPPNPMSFFSENVDAWGPVEWFNRLSKAVREHGDAVRANDETMMEICRNVAISSAWRLVGDYDQQVRAALTPNVAQGCGDPNCKDPNCTYGKGKPRCQNCGDPIAHGIYCGTCREMGCSVPSTEDQTP
jgi:Lar family restriction alleviation protein